MAALDWHALGEINSQPVHYRKWKVYELQETLEVAESMLCGAPYGGPVAAIRHPSKGPGAAATVAEPMEIRIYSSSGAGRKRGEKVLLWGRAQGRISF
jgi:hypothetical protein